MIENIIIGLISIIGTLLFFIWLSRKGDKDQLKYMRNDDLSDEQIIDIMGEEWFKRTKLLN